MGESMYSQTENENKEKTGQEFSQQMSTSSASVPIPGSHRGAHSLYDQFSPSPLMNSTIWSNRTTNSLLESTMKLEQSESLEPMLSFGMDDDDIFQVDKADLIQGPTLAELNANDDTLLGDLNFDDLLLPEENMQPARINSSIDLLPVSNSIFIPSNTGFSSNSFPQLGQSYRNCSQYESISGTDFNKSLSIIEPSETLSASSFHSPAASNLAGSSTASSSTSSHPNVRPIGQSTLHELLLKKSDLNQSEMNYSHVEMMGAMTNSKISRLSMSAPTQSLGMDQLWIHREPRQHLCSTGSLGMREAGSTSSLSTGSALSPNPLGHLDPLSHDEGYEDSDDDSDHYDDYSSENESGGSDIEEHTFNGRLTTELSTKESKQKREKYFWQYNVQAKGPKGQRLVARARLENPHVLNEATDPVFSPHCALRGIKHSGKARKGDGNDLTPNPRKLQNIGKELDKLSQIINDMTPVSELPFLIRPKTRKEKNKLASRACRLKKKAQHEANKIKLHGLEQEHRRLINGIQQAKQILAAKVSETNSENQEELSRQMDKICKNASKVKIANHSTEFVNRVLDKLKAGIYDGGLDDF